MKVSDKRHAVAVTRGWAIQILESLGTVISLECARLMKIGNDAALLDMKPNFGEADWRTLMKDYLAVELVSKADFLNLPGTNRAEVAIQKFLESEAHCYTTNVRFVSAIRDPVFPDSDVATVFHRARRKIARLLGEFSWEEAEGCMAFGPGASVGVTRKRSHAVHKFGLLRPTVTGECATLAQLLIRRCPQWSKTVPVISGMTEDCFSVVQGSRITTVSKNAKTDRVIAIEPLMNMYVQKGIGKLIRGQSRPS